MTLPPTGTIKFLSVEDIMASTRDTCGFNVAAVISEAIREH